MSAGKFANQDGAGSASITSFMSSVNSGQSSQASQSNHSQYFPDQSPLLSQLVTTNNTNKKNKYDISKFFSKSPLKTTVNEDFAVNKYIDKQEADTELNQCKNSPMKRFLISDQKECNQNQSKASGKGFFARKENKIDSVRSQFEIMETENGTQQKFLKMKSDKQIDVSNSESSLNNGLDSIIVFTPQNQSINRTKHEEDIQYGTEKPDMYPVQEQITNAPVCEDSNSGITTFDDVAQTSEEPLQSLSDQVVYDHADMMPCEKCGKAVSAWDLPEHLDFHFAQELQRQQNQIVTTPIVKKGKRKSEETSATSSTKKTKLSASTSSPSLYQFFNKK